MTKLKKILYKAVPFAICAAAVGIVSPVGIIKAAPNFKMGMYIPASINDIIVSVTAPTLNVRSGPGTDFAKIATVSRDDTLTVLGGLDGWYVVHLPDNSIGVVSSEYVEVKDEANTYMLARLTENVNTGNQADTAQNAFNTAVTAVNQPKTTSANVSKTEISEAKLTQLEFGKWAIQNFTKNSKSDTDTLLSLINKEREKVSAAPLKQDNTLTNIAYYKAAEMSQKQYFSHDSPIYGSPFEMLKHFGITYKRAAENIVGSSDTSSAHDMVMASPSHKVNVLNESFKSIGIGISGDARYGKIIVMMFVE